MTQTKIKKIMIDEDVIDTSGTPIANDYARFTDGDTVSGRSYSEVRADLNVEDGSEANNISDTNATDLTDAGDSTLHYHTADRARAVHTGTQTASTISDFTTTVQGLSINNVSEDTTPQLGGDLGWNSNGLMLESQTVGGSNGDIVYLSGSTTWSQADASVVSTSDSALGIRISSTTVLTHGVYTTTGLTAGSLYYISETAGDITATIPTTSTSIVRIIGYALSTTELFVNPDGTYVENA